MSVPAYLETWEAGDEGRTVDEQQVELCIGDCHFYMAVAGPEYDDDMARAKLAAAAPALVRALLAVEWAGSDRFKGKESACPACRETFSPHAPWCPVDSALTAAGFPDQPSRDAAREVIAHHAASAKGDSAP